MIYIHFVFCNYVNQLAITHYLSLLAYIAIFCHCSLLQIISLVHCTIIVHVICYKFLLASGLQGSNQCYQTSLKHVHVPIILKCGQLGN